MKGFLQTPRGCLEGLGERGCVRTPRVPSADRASPPDSSELPDGWVPSKCGVMYTGEGDPTAPCASTPSPNAIAWPSAVDPAPSPSSSPAMAKPTVRLMGWGLPGVPRMSIACRLAPDWSGGGARRGSRLAKNSQLLRVLFRYHAKQRIKRANSADADTTDTSRMSAHAVSLPTQLAPARAVARGKRAKTRARASTVRPSPAR